MIIVTESVFSMDGDRAPLAEIDRVEETLRRVLLLDEAHAIGVIGPHGRGLAAELGVEREVDVQMGTLSKALGVSGGYVCGSRSLIDWLINRARSFIFSTAPPPALAAAATAAMEFLGSAEGEDAPATLWKRIVECARNCPPAPAASGEHEERDHSLDRWRRTTRARSRARACSRKDCSFRRFVTRQWRKDAARLRITVSAAHTEAQIAHSAKPCDDLRRGRLRTGSGRARGAAAYGT